MKKRINFIPGTMCDIRLWDQLWHHLQKEHELFHTPVPEKENIDQILDSLKVTLPEDDIYLVGFSLGGFLASAFTIKYPERVKKLMVIANSPCKLPESELIEREKLIKWVERNGYSGLPQKRANQFLHHSNQNNPEIIKTILEMDQDLGESTLLNQIKVTTKRPDLSAPLLKAETPILFCIGEEDQLVNKGFICELVSKNKSIELQEIEGSGHMLPLEQPMKLAGVITKWFEL